MKWPGNRCARFREDICLWLSGAMPEPESNELKSHLAACADCREYCQQVKEVTTPLAQWEKSFAHLEPSRAARTRWAKAVLGATEPTVQRLTPRLVLLLCWRELIRPCRHAWTGMAALWLAMWAIHLHLSSGQPSGSSSNSAPTQAVVRALEEQRQVLAELIPPAANSPSTINRSPAGRSRHDNSRPRSQRSTNRKLA